MDDAEVRSGGLRISYSVYRIRIPVKICAEADHHTLILGVVCRHLRRVVYLEIEQIQHDVSLALYMVSPLVILDGRFGRLLWRFRWVLKR